MAGSPAVTPAGATRLHQVFKMRFRVKGDLWTLDLKGGLYYYRTMCTVEESRCNQRLDCSLHATQACSVLDGMELSDGSGKNL